MCVSVWMRAFMRVCVCVLYNLYTGTHVCILVWNMIMSMSTRVCNAGERVNHVWTHSFSKTKQSVPKIPVVSYLPNSPYDNVANFSSVAGLEGPDTDQLVDSLHHACHRGFQTVPLHHRAVASHEACVRGDNIA